MLLEMDELCGVGCDQMNPLDEMGDKKTMTKFFETEEVKQESYNWNRSRDDAKKTNPDRYFGSDLNKFIHEECGRKMVVNNIDLIMLKHRTGRNSLLRVIESKHSLEKPMNKGQKDVLKTLKDVFISGNLSMKEIDLELYVVYGDQPYDVLKVYDSINEVYFTIRGREAVIKWLEM